MTFDIHQPIVDPDYGEYDEAAAAKYQEALTNLFAESPEAQALVDEGRDVGWVPIFLEYGMSYLAVTPATMTVRNFEEVLFELFPRKVSTEPDSAPAIVAELRAFWTFLGRAYNLSNAPAILKQLDDRGVARLERELANPANFGMAKSMVMQGRARGFDMSTQEGMDAWIHTYNAEVAQSGPAPLGPGPFGPGLFGPVPFGPDLFFPGPAAPPSPGRKSTKAAKEKNRRKMAKASRKQNRRK